MTSRVRFGLSGHDRQTFLPGTDPAPLPDPAGLDAPPHPDALSSQPFTPGGDGVETLFDGRVTATTSGHGTDAERTVLDVVGPWNSVKNAAAASDEAAALAFVGFVHVDAAVGLSSEKGSTLELVGAKRGNLLTGAGADRIDVRLAANGAEWSNEFRVASGAGDDAVRFSLLDLEAAADAGDATFASAEATQFVWSRGGDRTTVRADLGEGADLFLAEGVMPAEVRGGAGDDVVSAGPGGGDTAVYDGAAAGYEVLPFADGRVVMVRDLDPADGDEGTDLLLGVDRLRFADRTDELPAGPPSLVFRAPAGRDLQYELWATDGTAAGTVPLRSFDEEVGYRYGGPYEWAALGDGRALVVFGDEGTAFEVWATDGTAAGTSLVKRFEGSFHMIDGQPYGPVAFGGGLAMFVTGDAVAGLEFWMTDGTAEGTVSVKRFDPADGYRYPTGMAPLGDDGRALFTVRDLAGAVELWATDGTADGASLVKAIGPGTATHDRDLLQGLTPLGDGRAVFGASGGAAGRELWVTDGTAEGTAMVEDINPGTGDSFPHNWAPLGDGRALFTVLKPAGGRELWVTDGTAAGTSVVMDVEPAEAWYESVRILALGDGRALFATESGALGRELWITDGTAEGTLLVKDIRPGGASSSPSQLTAIGDGRVLFSADDGVHGRELWITDGTAAGTDLVTDINPGEYGIDAGGLVALGDGRVLFIGWTELWITDGTATGTWPLPDAGPQGAYWGYRAVPVSGGTPGADPFT